MDGFQLDGSGGFSLDSGSSFNLDGKSSFSLDGSSGFSLGTSGNNTDGIPAPKQTTFEAVIDLLSKSPSLGLNAAGELFGLDSVKNIDVADILKGTKFVNINQFKNELLHKVGLKSIGKDGFINNATNFALNFIVESAFDPITYIPLMSIMSKAGKITKISKFAAKSFRNASLVRGGVGAVAGLASTRFDENGLRNSLHNIGVGFGAGLLSKYVSKTGVKVLGKLGDAFYDTLTKSTLGDDYFKLIGKFSKENQISPSQAFQLEKTFVKRTAPVKDMYLRVRTSFFKDLKSTGGDQIVKSLTGVVDEAFVNSITKRNKLIDFTLKTKNSLIPKGAKDVRKLTLSELNDITARVNTSVGQEVDSILKQANNPDLTKFVNRYIDDNRSIIKEFNINSPASMPNVVPIDFHTTDILLPDAVNKIYKLKGEGSIIEGFVKRTKEDVSGFLTLDKRVKIGAERFTEALATKIEKRAIDINSAIQINGSKILLGQEFGGNVDSAIGAWDKYRRLWKSSVLLASSSWIKNNMFENTVRAMMKLGIKRGAKVSFDQLPVSSTFQKLFKIASPVDGFKHLNVADEAIFLANKVGVLETNFFDDMLKRTGSETRLAKLNNLLSKTSDPLDIASVKKLIATETPGNIAKTLDGYQNFLNGTVGRYGQTVENGIRVSFFDDVVRHNIRKDKELASIINKNGLINTHGTNSKLQQIVSDAKELTNDTFFDYGNLSAFEEKIAKRIIPFYSFYSKNLAFWMREIETNGAGILKTVRAIRSTGRAPTEKERKGIPEWMLDSFYRLSDDGKDVIQIPNVSLADALDNFSARSFGGKLDPVLKTIVENMRNREFGLDQVIRPSDSKFGTKRLFSRALPLENFLPETGRDSKGNLITTSDVSGTIDNLRGNLFPTPLLDQILGARNDIVNKKKDTAITIGNKLLPIRRRNTVELFKRTLSRRKAINTLRNNTRRKLKGL